MVNENTLNQTRIPFSGMHIVDNKFLNEIDGRSACIKCHKSRKFFCYKCYIAVESLIGRLPQVKLPVKIDIIKHKSEIDGKSTAAHAAVLASEDVNIYTYPLIPDYSDEQNVVLIFPSLQSVNVNSLFNHHISTVKPNMITKKNKRRSIATLLTCKLEHIKLEDDEYDVNSDQNANQIKYTLDNLPVKRAVFIDSTWNQSRGIYKDPRIKSLKTIVLQNRLSQFWRHHKGSPRWYLATIEAIHQFLLEVHINAWGLNTDYHGLDDIESKMDSIHHEMYKKVSAEQRDCDMVDNNHNINEFSIQTGFELPYNGQYDNLLFFFTHMYKLIHSYYDHNKLKAYKRPNS